MSPKLHEFAVVLLRDGQATPWGIRLVGGNDLDTPLIITRVNGRYITRETVALWSLVVHSSKLSQRRNG